jgi:hypothetical protein
MATLDPTLEEDGLGVALEGALVCAPLLETVNAIAPDG